ncbi:MAG: hypothetical protein GY754_12885 [bacterium]|nr:hypothetical protein [bacterium]
MYEIFLKEKKSKQVLFLIALFLAFSTNGFPQPGLGLTSESSPEWKMIAGNSTCEISSDIKYAKPGSDKYPKIKVVLTYKGPKSLTINWDKNFGRVLWEGNVMLISDAGGSVETTGEMKFRTSNTYEPGSRVQLKRGQKLTSVLDFTKLPATYATGLFSSKGKVKFRLYIITADEMKLPISNELVIVVK